MQAHFTQVLSEELRRLGLEMLSADVDSGPGAYEFRNDDAGYLAWPAAHVDGYLINIPRGYGVKTARVHRASCRTITGQNAVGGLLTGQYVKVCADHLNELEQWATDEVGQPVQACRTCRPDVDGEPPTATGPTKPVALRTPEERWEINGPAVGAWADGYIRFEKCPSWQDELRSQIRSRCRQLEPSHEQVLHATFFGTKLANADVENLLLYNIDTFRTAGRNGIRFEYGANVPTAPDGTQYPFGYGYALAPLSGTFTHWQPGATLASFDWADLGTFLGEKKLAQVWLALARGKAAAHASATPGTTFAVRVHVRPPFGPPLVWGGLVKGLFDGVICAFHTHTDQDILGEVADRLSRVLPAVPGEIERFLLEKAGLCSAMFPGSSRPTGKASSGIPLITSALPENCSPLNPSIHDGRSRENWSRSFASPASRYS
ncbi:hypothetical protein [Mycolicibacterium sp. XJ870]